MTGKARRKGDCSFLLCLCRLPAGIQMYYVGLTSQAKELAGLCPWCGMSRVTSISLLLGRYEWQDHPGAVSRPDSAVTRHQELLQQREAAEHPALACPLRAIHTAFFSLASQSGPSLTAIAYSGCHGVIGGFVAVTAKHGLSGTGICSHMGLLLSVDTSQPRYASNWALHNY